MEAAYAVVLTDIYLDLVEEDGTFSSNNFAQQDFTCPFLCEDHALENHAEAEGLPVARGRSLYPYSNAHRAQGFTTYVDIRTWNAAHRQPIEQLTQEEFLERFPIKPYDHTLGHTDQG